MIDCMQDGDFKRMSSCETLALAVALALRLENHPHVVTSGSPRSSVIYLDALWLHLTPVSWDHL